MRVVLVRHAQSENNALRAPGIDHPDRVADPGLTPKGSRQVEWLRERFAREREAHGRVRVVTSPMRRAMLTALGVCAGLGTRGTVDARAHEHGGCFEGARGDGADGAMGRRGMTTDEIAREFGSHIDAPETMGEGWWDPRRGCETVEEAQRRGARFAEWLWERARAMGRGERDASDIIIVSHGMFIDILLKTLFASPRTTGKQGALFCSENACVHSLYFDVGEDGECVGLSVFNDVSHIPEEDRSGGSVDGLSEAYTNEGSA